MREATIRVRWKWACGAVAAFWLLGCNPGGWVILNHPFAPDGGPCRFVQLRFDNFPMAGEQAQVELGIDEKCQVDVYELNPAGVTATVEVLDPEGNSVAHLDGKPERRRVGGSAFEDLVKVTFTPDRAGTWRISADFGSRLGKTTQSIEVVGWRGDARARVVPWSVPADCVAYEVTDRETALCLRYSKSCSSPTFCSPPVPTLLTSRGQVLEGATFAVGNNALWRLLALDGGSRIERLEDNGSQFVVTHQLPHPFATNGAFALEGTGAWLFASTSDLDGPAALVHLEPKQDGGLWAGETAVHHTRAAALAIGSGAALLWGYTAVHGSRLAVATPDGGLWGIQSPGLLLGSDTKTVWLDLARFDDPPSFAIDVLAGWPEDGGLRTARLALPRHVRAVQEDLFPSIVPLIPLSWVQTGAPTLAVPRREEGKISLERFDAGAGFAAVSAATGTHAFARALDGSALKIFDR